MKKIPYIYILLYSKLKEENNGIILTKEKIDLVFNKHMKVSNIIKHFILEDMEECALVKKLSQRQWRLLSSNCDQELNKYKKYGKWLSSLPYANKNKFCSILF